MKLRTFMTTFVLLQAAGTASTVAAPVGTGLTYQGQLKLDARPLNDTADFRFTLWDDADAPSGTQIGPSVVFDGQSGNSEPIAVTGGLFTVQLDFGPNAFNGDARWLQIDVRSPHDPTDTELYTTLSPRQPIMPTPYAIRALEGGGTGDGHSLDAADGNPVNAVYVDDDGNVGIGTTTPAEALDVDGSVAITDALRLADDEGQLRIFSSKTNFKGAYVLLHGADKPNSPGLLAFTHGDYTAPAPDSEVSFRYANDGTVTKQMVITSSGNLGVGTATPDDTLDVDGSIDSTEGYKVDGSQMISSTGGAHTARHTLDSRYGIFEVRNSAGQRGAYFGYGSPGSYVDLKLESGNSLRVSGGNVGIGTTSPAAKLHVAGSIATTGDVGIGTATVPELTNRKHLLLSDIRGARISLQSNYQGITKESRIQHYDGSSPAEVEGLRLESSMQINMYTDDTHRMIIRHDGNVGIGTTSPSEKLDVAGAIRIRGGSDLAERFDVDGQSVEPGMVVSIDPSNPGRLRVATEAYDCLVAGVVSGANGVRPGLVLHQEGTLADGEYPVSIAGRVYCWCDADAGGAISPGVLLTTSSTPGHAMRVDATHVIPRGCVIGKAMTKLEAGRGLVLVLVQPQ